LIRGGFAGWLSDDRLLLSGRESFDSEESVLFSYALADGSTVELLRAERPRGFQLSPDRRWMVYYISLSDEPAENGLWLLRTEDGARRPLARELFGSYAWRDSSRLLIIPFRPDAQYHEFWELDVESGEVRQLTDPAINPFKIANGDWQVSPDGRQVTFVESSDENLWLLTLPD
jgi:Tol biopolymer transport system component